MDVLAPSFSHPHHQVYEISSGSEDEGEAGGAKEDDEVVVVMDAVKSEASPSSADNPQVHPPHQPSFESPTMTSSTDCHRLLPAPPQAPAEQPRVHIRPTIKRPRVLVPPPPLSLTSTALTTVDVRAMITKLERAADADAESVVRGWPPTEIARAHVSPTL